MNGDAEGRTALILYGTETGTAQDLAEEVGRVTERLHFGTTVAELNHVPVTLPSTYTITIFVLSTTGQGEFPSNARVFWTNLLKKKLPATFLQDVSFFLVGLGDTSYPKFNWAARKLGKRLKQLGALEVIDSCEADEQGEESTDGAFLAWLPLFKAALLKDFPLPDGLQPISDDQSLPSKWVLEQAPAILNGHTDGSFNLAANKDTVELSSRLNGETSITHPDHDTRPIPDSFSVYLKENRRVTPSSHWQDVRLLTLTTNQSINYFPGDALSIIPKNFPEDVNALIQLMDWTSMADTPITFTPTCNLNNFTNYPPCPIPYLLSSSPSTTNLTLRSLLTSYLDINSIPRRSLFATLSRYSIDNPTQRDRLLEFTLPQYLDEYYDYATRAHRSILEILQEFDSVKIPWWEAANVFPMMRARQFSIASGGRSRRIPEDDGGGTKFELLVAIVKYSTVIKKIRQGVCTRYLAVLAPGSTLNVVHRTEGRFYTNAKTPKQTRQSRKPAEQQEEDYSTRPKLLIGAGTGIAPLRAIIQHDDEAASTVPKPGQYPATTTTTTTLFLGARNHAQDFFFADEWTAKLTPNHHPSPSPSAEAGTEQFKLIPAFSRDQPQKIYLQHRLREHGALVFELLVNRNATVVVCGSSGAMPKAVRGALVDVLVGAGEGGGRREGDGGEGEEQWTQEQAESYLDAMEKERRYLQETW